MPLYKPELFTIDSVMDFYQNANGVHYKVYGGTSPKAEFCRYTFDGNEKEIGMQELEKALVNLKSNTENTNPYTIQVFTKEKKKKDGTSTGYSTTQISFQLNKAERYLPYPGVGMTQQTDPDLKLMLTKIVETQNLLISKLSEEEYEEEEDKKDSGGFLGAVLNNEKFQEMAIAAISGIFTNNMMRQQPTALAGIPNEDQQNKALQAIQLIANKDPHFGDHLLYLANLDNEKYQFLLSFINK